MLKMTTCLPLKTAHFKDQHSKIPYILTYRSQLFSRIFRPKTRVRPIRWSYLSENFHQVGTKAKLIGYCVHALVHAHTKTTIAQGHAPVISAYVIMCVYIFVISQTGLGV